MFKLYHIGLKQYVTVIEVKDGHVYYWDPTTRTWKWMTSNGFVPTEEDHVTAGN